MSRKLDKNISASRDYAVKYHHIFEILHLFVIKQHHHTGHWEINYRKIIGIYWRLSDKFIG